MVFSAYFQVMWCNEFTTNKKKDFYLNIKSLENKNLKRLIQTCCIHKYTKQIGIQLEFILGLEKKFNTKIKLLFYVLFCEDN